MKIKKFVTFVLLAVTAVCLLCACSASPGTQTEEETASELPELKIGVDILKPFFFTDENGQYAGIDADIATEACRRAGYEPVFVPIDWDCKDTFLKEGTVDCLWSAFSINGREDSYLWTDSYLQSNLRAIVDARSPDRNLNAVREHVGMAVRAGSKLEEILLQKKVEGIPFYVYSCGSFEMAETAFVKGYVGALGCHEVVLEQVMSNYPGLYRFLDGNIMTVDLGVAFRKEDSTEKRDQLNAAFKEMKADGTIAEIFARYCADSSENKEAAENAEK